VHLSGRCLAAPDLVDRVRRALRRHGVPGDLLTLEISEGIVTEHVAGDTVLADLRALGLRLAMDDFGTGYSTLARLRRLPIDVMKIDRSLVSTERGASFITRSVIELGHSLGVRVVAKGVEDELTLERLSSMGCDELQGFALGRPLADDRLECWVLASTGVRPPASDSPYRRLFLRG
jgi:EAL domain-containing protein (putative c-di-GMP-specific phosphodiesterase class I)